jgi:hypothetical protein
MLVGASQVKWNREDRHVLATSHDGDIRVWDLRVSMAKYNEVVMVMMTTMMMMMMMKLVNVFTTAHV